MSERRERAVSHSLSCTALERERIRGLADDAGDSMSCFIMDWMLGRDGSGGDGHPVAAMRCCSLPCSNG